jgi:imidazolonepropionase-like amidohydrolase
VEGAPADLAVFSADPMTDPVTLLSPVRIVLRGKVVR